MNISDIARRTICLVLLLLLPLSVFAQGNRHNAADEYRRAFALIDQIDPADREILANIDWNLPTFSRAEQAAIRRARPVIEAFRAGAARPFVDFEIDYSAGPETLLPHLSPMRQGTRLLMADARLRIMEGDVRGATANLRSMMKLSDHATSDPVLISTLVGTAIFAASNDSIRQMLGEGSIDQTGVRDLLSTMEEIVQPDPFGVAAALQGERDAFAGWMIQTYSEAGDAAQFVEDIAQYGASDDMLGLGAEIAAMDGDGFRAAMSGYDEAMRQIVEAAQIEDLNLAQSEMARVTNAIEQGQFGPVALMFVPAFDRVMENVLLAYSSMAELKDDLTKAAESEDALNDFQDAAAWYRRAISSLKREFAQDITPFREWVLADHMVDNELPQRLKSLTETRDALAKAAEIRKCDFDYQRRWHRDGLRARLLHLEDMRSLAAFIAVDARIALDEGRIEDAGNRLSWLIAMSDHLGQTPWPESSHAAMYPLELAVEGVSRALVEDDSRAAAFNPIHRMLHRISPDNPLGINELLGNYPSITTDWMLAHYPGQNAVHSFLRDAAFKAPELADGLRAAFGSQTPEVLRSETAAMAHELNELVPLAREQNAQVVRHAVTTRIAAAESRGMMEFARFLLEPIAVFVERREQAREYVETLRILTNPR